MDVSSESGDSACYSDISSESDVDSFSDVSDFSDDGAYEMETKRLTSLCFYERGLRDFFETNIDSFKTWLLSQGTKGSSAKNATISEQCCNVYKRNIQKCLQASPTVETDRIATIYRQYKYEEPKLWRFEGAFITKMKWFFESSHADDGRSNYNIKPAMGQFVEWIVKKVRLESSCDKPNCNCRELDTSLEYALEYCPYCACGCSICHGNRGVCPGLFQCTLCERNASLCMFNHCIKDINKLAISNDLKRQHFAKLLCNCCFHEGKGKKKTGRRKRKQRPQKKIPLLTQNAEVEIDRKKGWHKRWNRIGHHALGIDFEELENIIETEKGQLELNSKYMGKIVDRHNWKTSYDVDDKDFFGIVCVKNNFYKPLDVVVLKKRLDNKKIYRVLSCGMNRFDDRVRYQYNIVDVSRTLLSTQSVQTTTVDGSDIKGMFVYKEELRRVASSCLSVTRKYEEQCRNQVVKYISNRRMPPNWNVNNLKYSEGKKYLLEYRERLEKKIEEIGEKMIAWKYNSLSLLEKFKKGEECDNQQLSALFKEYISSKHECDESQVSWNINNGRATKIYILKKRVKEEGRKIRAKNRIVKAWFSYKQRQKGRLWRKRLNGLLQLQSSIHFGILKRFFSKRKAFIAEARAERERMRRKTLGATKMFLQFQALHLRSRLLRGFKAFYSPYIHMKRRRVAFKLYCVRKSLFREAFEILYNHEEELDENDYLT